MQDVVSNIHSRRKKNRFTYSKEKRWLRYGLLAVFIIAALAGINVIVSLLAPYSSYGRIASNLFKPVYEAGNNVLASIAESVDSYAFYSVDVWIKSMPTFIIAVVTFIIIAILAWRGGRTYCRWALSSASLPASRGSRYVLTRTSALNAAFAQRTAKPLR